MNTIKYNNILLNIPLRYNNNNLLNRFKINKYEEDECTLIKYLDKYDNVLELGSCLGYLSVLVSNKVSNIISIEANPELMESLNKTKKDNNCDNLYFFNTIIDKNQDEKEFYTYDLIVAGSADRDDKNDPGSINKWNKNIKKYMIKTSTITDIEENNNIKFNSLILDIEGGELSFFEQYKDYIKLNINKIIVELHGVFMNDKKYDEKCIDILNNIGFKILDKINGSYYFKKI